jgi:hypothetical protein
MELLKTRETHPGVWGVYAPTPGALSGERLLAFIRKHANSSLYFLSPVVAEGASSSLTGEGHSTMERALTALAGWLASGHRETAHFD